MEEKRIVKLINLIKNNDNNYNLFYNNNLQCISQEIDEILENDNFQDIINLLDVNSFYEIILKLYYGNINLEKINLFLGKLWARFYNILNNKEKECFLYKIVDKKNNIDRWSIIQLLNTFLEFISDLELNFGAKWFVLLSQFVYNDGASFIFYNSLDKYILNHKESAFGILQKYLSSECNKDTAVLIPIFLGCLRFKDKDIVNMVDENLQNSKDIEKLKLFYKSLVYSYRQDNNFNVLKLDAILNKDIRLQEIAFQMAFILYNSFNNNKKIQNDIFNWIIKRITIKELTDISKIYILQIIGCHIDSSVYDYNKICDVVVKLSPIKKESLRVWEELSYVLCKFIKDIDKFKMLLNIIINEYKYDFINNIKNLKLFVSKFISCKNIKLYTELFFSKNKYEREFIQAIYFDFTYGKEKIELNVNDIKPISDNILEIVFKEVICKAIFGDKIFLFISSINEILDDVKDNNLKKTIKQEIAEQCISYCGDCFIKLSKLDNKSKSLQEALNIAKQYHDNQKKCRESSVNSFSFPGCFETALRSKYIQNLEIAECSREKSELLKLCYSVNLLYCDKFLFFDGSKLKGNSLSGEPQNFITNSFSIENPIVYILDPCLKKYKILKYLNDIDRLQEVIDNEK